jgi:hypothetical protein
VHPLYAPWLLCDVSLELLSSSVDLKANGRGDDELWSEKSHQQFEYRSAHSDHHY